MQINVTGHHLDLTDALRDYVHDKFKRLERHFDHINKEGFLSDEHLELITVVDTFEDETSRLKINSLQGVALTVKKKSYRYNIL